MQEAVPHVWAILSFGSNFPSALLVREHGFCWPCTFWPTAPPAVEELPHG
jgi:hypothetical protein